MSRRLLSTVQKLATGNKSSLRRFISTQTQSKFAQVQEYKFPNYLLKAPATHVTTLGNGMRVATEEGVGQTATIGVFISAGSRYENNSNNGVAHFLEHMIFKGTKNRSLVDIEQEYENIGGHLNAYTSREHTVFTANVLKDDVEKAVASLADLLQNSELNEQAIENERSTILREMEEVENNIEEVVTDQLHATAYQGTPLAFTILGPKENILKISRTQIKEYIDTHYTGPRMVLVGAGKVDHDQLVKLADKYFGKVPATAPSNLQFDLIPARYTGSDIRIHNEDFPMTHISIGLEGPGWSSPDSFAIMLIQQLLGSWDKTSGSGKNLSSILCQKVANDDLARSVSAFSLMYTDTSLFGVSAVAPPEAHEELTYAIMNELVRLCFKVKEEDVARARNTLKTQLLMNQDGSSHAICEDIGRQMIFYGRRLTPAEIFARIDAIDADTIRRVAMKYIYDRDPVMAAYGKIDHIPDYNLLRSWTYWLRY
eukprot:GEZU01011185.1.p1 GENE.GEZU01011185.1~~GEZU01011185.1.p1  ORF type:complete len:484 (-),score=168.05 GEZU01011185.1:650-2101(-)